MTLRIYSNGITFRVVRKGLFFEHFLDNRVRNVCENWETPIEFKTKELALIWIKKTFGEEGIKVVEPSPWNQV